MSELTWEQLRHYRGEGNPDPERFAGQDAMVTPLARWFGDGRGIDPYAIPGLTDLLLFADAYAGEPGRLAGKTDCQRRHVQNIRFDLELKRVPFYPERIGDSRDIDGLGALESQVLAIVREHGVLDRTIIRSFDHRCIRALRAMEPALTTAVLVTGTAPVDPAQLTRAAQAQIYCAHYEFLDEAQVRQLHAQGIRVLPWTVNEPAQWERLYAWGVDGITTDYPDRLSAWLARAAQAGKREAKSSS